MPKYQLNFVADMQYDVEAENQEDAIEMGFTFLYEISSGDIYWDCNEAIELDED